MSGLLFFLPMAIQGGLAILASLVVFPESVSHSFQSKFIDILAPMSSALRDTENLFATIEDKNIDLENLAAQSLVVRQQLLKSLDNVGPLRLQLSYLRVDINYAVLSTQDLAEAFRLLAAAQARAGGLAFFFDVVVHNVRHDHLDSTAWIARDHTRDHHDITSDGASHEVPHQDQATYINSSHPNAPPISRNGSSENIFSRPLTPTHRGSHLSLLDHLRKVQRPVGLWESQRYMDIERPFANDTQDATEQMAIVAKTSRNLISACRDGIESSNSWFIAVNKGHRGVSVHKSIQALEGGLSEFSTLRLEVLTSYRKALDSSSDHEYRKLHYRNLFQTFVAQYHLIEFAQAVLDVLRHIEQLQATRHCRKLRFPKMPDLLRHARLSHTEKPMGGDQDNNHDEGLGDEDDLLGMAKRRNPEFAPFDNFWLNVLSRIAAFLDIFHSPGYMFFLKAAVLTALTALPQYLARSAGFYYYNRGVWCTILAQLTLAIYSGDTASAWVSRIVASFWGSLCGMIVWYIGSGSSSGNAYGIGAITAVTFPLAMFFRLHFPGQVLTAVFSTVTFALVIGYSYLNGTIVELTNAGWGWSVAWRRFVCVVIGITAAFIFSYIPPVYSSKRSIRKSYAALIADAATAFCSILSQANSNHMGDDPTIREMILMSRAKLAKLANRHANAKFEYSLRGRWPEERYKVSQCVDGVMLIAFQALMEAVRDALMSLHQLHHVLSQLDRPWRKVLLNRIQFDNPAFLGDILAVFSMCSTALASGTALPQITPSPLVARLVR